MLGTMIDLAEIKSQNHDLCQRTPTRLREDKHEGTVVGGKRRGFRDFAIASSLSLPLITRSVTFSIYLNCESVSLSEYRLLMAVLQDCHDH